MYMNIYKTEEVNNIITHNLNMYLFIKQDNHCLKCFFPFNKFMILNIKDKNANDTIIKKYLFSLISYKVYMSNDIKYLTTFGILERSWKPTNVANFDGSQVDTIMFKIMLKMLVNFILQTHIKMFKMLIKHIP